MPTKLFGTMDTSGFGIRTHNVNALLFFRYMCTRNNNFTNRGQKGVVVVKGNKKDAAKSSDERYLN